MKSALSFLKAAKRSEIASLRRLVLTGALVNAVGRLVHALQRERGLSNLFLGSQGRHWADERLAQVAGSQGLQEEVLYAFEQLDTDTGPSGHRARLFAAIAYAMQGLAALGTLREQVQARHWSAPRATEAYVRVISALLAVVFEAADSALDPDISRHLVAFFNFLQGKEFAGQERAAGSALFAAGRAETDSQQRLLHLIESQERCLQVFADVAGPGLSTTWQQLQRPDHLLPLERLRRVLCTTPADGPLDTGLSQVWFDACTARLDAMKSVEDALASELQALCGQRLRATEQELAELERLGDQLRAAGPSAPDSAFFDEPTGAAVLPASLAVGPPVDGSVLALVRDQARRLQAMGDELDTVRASLNERKTIERAKGLLMAHRQLGEDEAHKTMRQMAMNQSRRLVDVAEAVLAMAAVLPPPPGR
ncbi:nitrate- and nitrite sensing domain-containing protein [Ideonella sp. 4Y16]|uniref:nitrate regulatory protein n=1 Tax=Ideonella alba TaxID=2824118 RepID=UPI001B366D66|nr:nitrate regulatory protein [Ideonella alba]MBQ0945467.1 nitrate- and nitrite sensing domain-containing protein [Ideonella alba]